MERQRSAVKMDRQKSAVSVRSNLSKNSRSPQTGRSLTQTGRAPPGGKTLDYPCMACQSEGKTVEATNFCSDCAENLCADCVKQHQKFPAMKTHRILGKSERRKGDVTPAVNPLECVLHPGKLVELYCEDHDEIWCGACIAVHHRKCKNTMLLDKAAKGILQSDDVQYIKDSTKTVKKNLVTLRKKADSNLSRLEKQKAAVLTRMKTFRQKIDQAIDKLEEATVKELDQAVERAKIYTEADKKLYGEMISTLDAVLNMVVKTKGKDVSEAVVFVGIKRAKQQMLESERVINFAKNSAGQEALRFIPDTRIINWIKSLKQLGTFAHQQRSYSGTLLGKYNVKAKTDSSSCDIFGCDILPDGRLLLTDWDNRNVKLLDSTYSVVNQCSLPGNPLDICCINTEEAVVSLTMQKLLQFVSINTTVTATHTVATEENCRGIAYHDGQLFVLCGGFKREGEACISVLSVTGEPLSTIKTNNVNQKIFASPISIAIDADGMLYHVTDGQRGVVTLTATNDVLSVVSCRDVAWPCAICMDREGNSLICNGKSNTVIQMSTLSKFTKILTFEDGIKNPHAVCYDQNNLRLIVTSKGNHIAVYQLISRGMSDVAKDVKPIIPQAESETVDSNKTSSTIDTKSATKSNTKKVNEKANVPIVNTGNVDANTVEDRTIPNTTDKNREVENDKKRTAAFSTMTQKLQDSKKALKTMQDVTKANTSPENKNKVEEIKESKEIRRNSVTDGKTESTVSSSRQSKEKTNINRQGTKQEDIKSQKSTGKNGTSANLAASRQQSNLETVTGNKSISDSTNTTGRRPQTASTESTRKQTNSQSSSSKGIKNTPRAINAISLKAKAKAMPVPETPKLTTTLSGKKGTKPDIKVTNTETVEDYLANNPNAAVDSKKDPQKDIGKDTSETVEDETDRKSGKTETKSNTHRKGEKETLTKSNRKKSASLQSPSSKVAPSPRPSTRDSSSTRSGQKPGKTGL